MKIVLCCICAAAILTVAASAPADGFVFPNERRRGRKLEPIITPPVLPILEHLERDPSTLLPNETGPGFRNRGPSKQGPGRPRFGLGGGFSVAPSNNGGLTASISSSASGAGASQAASQSFSFGFDHGFSASHSASQSSSFSSNGFNNGFSGSQAGSQSASFSGGSAAAAASSSSAFSGGGNAGSQSASSAFGVNSLNNGWNQPPNDEVNFGEGLLDVRHRGGPGAFPFGRSPGRSVGAAAARVTKNRPSSRRGSDEWLAILVSD